MMRFLFAAVVTCALALPAAISVQAQTAAPTPSPTPIQGFSARGTLAVQAQFAGTPMTLGTEIAVMSSKRRVRIDLLSVSLSGGGPSASSMLPPLPQGAITLVYDQSTGLTTIWSDQRRIYYQTKSKLTTPKPTPTPSSTPGSGFDQFLRSTKSFTEYDVFNSSMALVGHQPINGHTSSLFHFTVQSQKHGKKEEDLSGDLALADDLSGLPIRLWLIGKGEHDGSIKLDLVSSSLTPPNDSVFALPRGYRRVKDMMEFLNTGSPTPAAAPSPVPTHTPAGRS